MIDNWWTISHAHVACRANPSCTDDPDDPANVLEYIDALKAQFAVSAMCQGVSVFDYRGPNYRQTPAMPDDREQLMIDYGPNQSVQSFTIMGKPSNNIAGTGSIEEIVRRSCAAARGLGAKVQ